jgi:hypothetical protein
VLDKALELSGYDHWRAGQKRLREQEGRYIGIGVISAQERSVFSATEFWFWFDEPGAPAAINAAVNDALAPLGVRLTGLPMTPERILSALRDAGQTG